MSVNLMAKFSSMFEQFQSRDTNIPCSTSSAVLGHSATRTEPASRRPIDRIRCPTGLRFQKGREDPVPQEDFSDSDRIIDETGLLRLLGFLQGIPESLRVSAGLQLLSGITRLELGLIRNLMRMMMMMMIEILKRMVHNLIRPMYVYCITFMTVFRIRYQPPLLGSIHDASLRNFSQHRRLHHLRNPF